MSMKSSLIPLMMGFILSSAIANAGPAPTGAEKAKSATEPTTDELRKLTGDLKRLEPIILRLEKMQGVMAIARQTSPTLEKLDRLMVKADLVEKVNALLARVDKIEPILKSLEEMQRDIADRRRKETGVASAPIEKWSEIFNQLQDRLDALEKRLYAPSSLDDPAARQTPVELRIKALEDRQQALVKEVETLRKENQRVRRRLRQDNP